MTEEDRLLRRYYHSVTLTTRIRCHKSSICGFQSFFLPCYTKISSSLHFIKSHRGCPFKELYGWY